EHPGVDALLVLHAPPLAPRTEEVVRAVASAAPESPDKPVVAVFLGPNEPAALARAGVLPVFAFPEGAVYALGQVARYAAWRSDPPGVVPDLPGCDGTRARSRAVELLAGAAPTGRWVEPYETIALLGTFGVTPVAQRLVHTVDEAITVAGEIGYPVALKAVGLRRPAKTEAGGVAVDVHGDEELRAAYERMAGLHGPAMHPALVQVMAPTGDDVAVGLHQHPALGSVVTLGVAGSDAIELRIVPLTDVDARRLADTIPGLDALGASALVELLLRLSALAEAVPEIAFLRLDPVLVSPAGALPTDTRMRLAPWTLVPDPAIRRLSPADRGSKTD
ncbi:MAG: acetate--CoA ligase family protein, partial [Acidimicrobiales bacterium]